MKHILTHHHHCKADTDQYDQMITDHWETEGKIRHDIIRKVDQGAQFQTRCSPGLNVPQLQCTLGAPQQHLVQVRAWMHHGRHVEGHRVKLQPQVDIWEAEKAKHDG